MSLHIHVPSAPLCDFVEMFWFWENYHPAHDKERILPIGMMEITISLSQRPFYIYEDESSPQASDYSMAMLAGARSDFFIIDTSAPTSILSIVFKPGAAFPFVGFSATEYLNQHYPLQDIWGSQATELLERLFHATQVNDYFAILEQTLLTRLFQSEGRHPAVPYALDIFHSKPQTPVAQVVDQLALSPTRFIQVFREDVGLTPKLFCRVQRFQQALRMIAQNDLTSWVDVALHCGYYDQSHFINDFQAFAGISPSHFAPQSREHFTNLPVWD